MPLPCSIDSLPAEAREALDGWLRDPAVTQTDATRRVNELLENLGQGERRLSPQAADRVTLMAEQLESSSEISARLERQAKREAEEERKAKAALEPLNLTEHDAERMREMAQKIYSGQSP